MRANFGDKQTKIIEDEQHIFSGLSFIWFVISNYCRNLCLTRTITNTRDPSDSPSQSEYLFSDVMDVADDVLPLLDHFCPFIIRYVKEF